jgi:hypothetical protein
MRRQGNVRKQGRSRTMISIACQSGKAYRCLARIRRRHPRTCRRRVASIVVGCRPKGEIDVYPVKNFGAACVATLLLVSQALAHGGVSQEGSRCIMRIGPYMMNFTGYQPATKGQETFCDDIPDAGHTIIVLDVEQMSAGAADVTTNYNDLRQMDIDFRVLKNVGQARDEDNMEQNTEIYIPKKKYPGGTLHFEYNFKEPGKFIGLVSATDDHGRVYVSRFPFSVGEGMNQMLLMIALVGAIAAAGIGGYFYHSRNKAVKA